MGKADFLSPKAISNRIKAKGLQKLRWYCQMCQKQCRDEVRSLNGFSLVCTCSRFLTVCLLLTEWIQVSLHVRVPPEAAAAGLREPHQVHGLLLRVSSVMFMFKILMKRIVCSYSCCSSPSEFRSDFIELLRRRFGEMGFSSHPDVSRRSSSCLQPALRVCLLVSHPQVPSECTTTLSTTSTSVTGSTSI